MSAKPAWPWGSSAGGLASVQPRSAYQEELFGRCRTTLEKRLILHLCSFFGDERVKAWAPMLQAGFTFSDGNLQIESEVDLLLRPGHQFVVVDVDGEAHHDPTVTGRWDSSDPTEFCATYVHQVLRQNSLTLRSNALYRWCGAHFDRPDFEEILAKTLSPGLESPLAQAIRRLPLEGGSCRCLAELSAGGELLAEVLRNVLPIGWLPGLHSGSCPALEALSLPGRPSLALLCEPRPVAFFVDHPRDAHQDWYVSILDVQNALTRAGCQVIRFVEQALAENPEHYRNLIADYTRFWELPITPMAVPVFPFGPAATRTEVPDEHRARFLLGSRQIATFNAWRRRSGFSPLDLVGVDLAGANLAGIDFTGCIMVGANLARADLTNANFLGVNLQDANLSGAQLHGASFLQGDISGVVFGDQDPALIYAQWPENRYLAPREAIRAILPAGGIVNQGGVVNLPVTLANEGDVLKQVAITLYCGETEVATGRASIPPEVSVTLTLSASGITAWRDTGSVRVTYETMRGPQREEHELRVREVTPEGTSRSKAQYPDQSRAAQALVYEDLQALGEALLGEVEPPTIVLGGPPAPQFEIPPPPAPGNSVRLDPGRVQATIRETESVAALLGGIFRAEGGPATPPQGANNSLDPPHSKLLSGLGGKSVMQRQEFEECCKELGLLPAGALECLNEAAFDLGGEALIEGDDPLEINQDIWEELCR